MTWRADWDISQRVIGAAIGIHSALGPGLLECVYEECLCWKLKRLDIAFVRQKHIPITFEGMTFPGAFRLDLIVEKRVVIEIKAIEALTPLHKSQLLTYLKMTGLQSGLLINFNSWPLKKGIKRVEIPAPTPPSS